MTKALRAYLPNRTLVLAASEVSLVFLALLAATYARLGARAPIILEYGNGFFKIGLVSAVCPMCMYYYDLYDAFVLTNPREITSRLFQMLGTVCLVLTTLYYVCPMVGLGARVVLTGMVLAGVLLALSRKVFLAVNRSALLCERVVLLGEGALIPALASELTSRPQAGMRLLGYLTAGGQPVDGIGSLEHLGQIGELAEVVESREIDRVIVTMADRRGNLPVDLLLNLRVRGVPIQDGADVYEAITGKVPVDSIRLSWFLFSPGFSSSWALRLYKRVASVILSLIGLAVASPLLALIAAAIWLDSGSPVIFRQRRVGKNGRIFTLFKFRSMRHGVDAGDDRARPAERNDERCTRVGKWLRRTRLDELPQFYNILRGDMCFVGPRPFVPDQERECVEQIPYYAHRWSVTPGATGWAQVHQGYCTCLEDNSEKLAYDLFYIKHVSIGLDVLILIQTTKILLLG
ncbi:MAG: exopolysaccharide biosynthesis polyprenyl glycosylphosphotransferase, partial [Terracidiphilus sp.]